MSKIGIKFFEGGKVYAFDNNGLELNINDQVVVETIRGLEIGIVTKLSSFEHEDEVKKIIRIATEQDKEKADALKNKEQETITMTRQLIQKYNLNMKLVDASFTLDGSKVIINYVCEDRVDFRELVKELAGALKLRIELRQIGIRDQAKKVGGIGCCGKECCCKKYLNDFDKVSIKMAKTQGLSLTPTKISGICGRLMCCLSYENEFYSEISTKMPKIGSRVKTKDGEGSVAYNNLLKQIITVRVDNGNEVKMGEYALADIEMLARDNNQEQRPNQQKSKDEKFSDKQNHHDKQKSNFSQKSHDKKPFEQKQNQQQNSSHRNEQKPATKFVPQEIGVKTGDNENANKNTNQNNKNANQNNSNTQNNQKNTNTQNSKSNTANIRVNINNQSSQNTTNTQGNTNNQNNLVMQNNQSNQKQSGSQGSQNATANTQGNTNNQDGQNDRQKNFKNFKKKKKFKNKNETK